EYMARVTSGSLWGHDPDLQDAIVPEVGDVEVAVAVEGDARRAAPVGDVELRVVRTADPVAPAAQTGNGRDRIGDRAPLAHFVVAEVGEVEVAEPVKADRVRVVQLRGPARRAVAVPEGAAPDHRGERTAVVPDDLVDVGFRDVEDAV